VPALTPAKRNRLILITLVCSLLIWALYSARHALFPFIGGLIAGYIILPVVNFIDHRLILLMRNRKWSRGVAILLVYLVVLLIIGMIVAFLIPALSDQLGSLQDRMPYLFTRIGELVTEGLGRYESSIPINLRAVVTENLARLSTEIGQAVQQTITQALTVVTTTISFIVGITIIPIWLFYVLLDEHKGKRMVLLLIPRGQRADARNIYTIVDNTLGAYLRGQLILGASISVMSLITLLIIGVDPALLLAMMAGGLEMLPYIGPIITLVITSLIALLQSPIKAFWTVIAYLIVQQLESSLFVPQITGNSVRLHPALVMVVLIIGNEIAGIWGMLLVVPLTAVIRDVVKYLYLRFSDVEVDANEALARVQGRYIPRLNEMALDVFDDVITTKEG
jgi:predicted PurR-regulated permease PerM